MENALDFKTERRLKTSITFEELMDGLAIVLAILALMKVLPFMLTAIAVFAVGLSFLLEGIAIWANYSSRPKLTSEEKTEVIDFTGGVTIEFIGGLAGMILSILSLMGIVPNILVPVAVMVFGFTFAFSSGETAYFRSMEHYKNEKVHKMVNKAIRGMAGIQLLVGLGAIGSGMVALTGAANLTLLICTITILVIGVVEFSKGFAWRAEMR